MSQLDEILDKSMYKQDFWTKEVKREISDIEAKQQIKALMLELAESCEENWGNGKPLIDPEVIKEKINNL